MSARDFPRLIGQVRVCSDQAAMQVNHLLVVQMIWEHKRLGNTIVDLVVKVKMLARWGANSQVAPMYIMYPPSIRRLIEHRKT